MEVGDILQSLCFRAVICHGMPGADHGKSIIKLPEGVGGDTGFFILRVEGDKPAVFVPFIGMRKIFHPVTGSSDDVFVAMTLIGAVKAGEIYTEEGEAFRNGLSDEVFLFERKCRKVEKLQIPIVGDGETDVDLIFVKINEMHSRKLLS